MSRPKERKPIRDSSDKFHVTTEEWPLDLYPKYAQGKGYVLSRKFNECAVSQLSTIPFLPIEDAATGMLAEKCGVSCSNDGWAWWRNAPETGSRHEFLSHRVKGSREMVYKYWEMLKDRKLGEWRDT